jgi:hypothetical protein
MAEISMQFIDISTIEYDVELFDETGAKWLLNDALLSLTWEEQENELAQRAALTVANMQLGSTWLMNIAKLCCVILIYGKWGDGRKLLFEGKIWEWEYKSETQKELTLTAYDCLKTLRNCQKIS